MRPEAGTQAQFPKGKAKPPKTYKYDSSLSPALNWDENAAREQGEALIREILDAESLEKAKAAASRLKAMSKPFLNWTGKAERLSFDVPTLPLFIHERLSTKAILETLAGHKRDQQLDFEDLFGDPHHPITDQLLKAYEHKDQWVNRMILGDSLVVMNSLLEYEGLGGQVQMIYMDPPYGVKFGSNFQPFVRKRDVAHGDDEAITREPEMVQAYRDTWELGVHSYLAYLRDRLFVARHLLTPTGSVFVQISDENVHHVRELLDETFGAENFVSLITLKKTTGAGSPSVGTDVIASVADYVLWYAKDIAQLKYRQLYAFKTISEAELGAYSRVELPDGTRRGLRPEEKANLQLLPAGSRLFSLDNLTSQSGAVTTSFVFDFKGGKFSAGRGFWKTNLEGVKSLERAKRLAVAGNTLRYVRFLDDFPCQPISNMWTDTTVAGFASDKLYVVQTSPKIIQRCMLMATDPGDLVIDPTCGSGTTAYVAEQWGRRWITIDTSRVPLALARQRLLSATFPYYELKDLHRGPAGGFVYKRKQNRKGEEVGGIVPHVTLKSIANNEPPQEEVLVDRPEEDSKIVRVTGPFTFEATIPTALQADEAAAADGQKGVGADDSSFHQRMIEILRKTPVLRVAGNKSVSIKNVRLPAKTLALSAEGTVANGQDKPVAFIFGPENGPVSEGLVFEAAKEANLKGHAALYVIGFSIQPNARLFIEKCEKALGVPAFYIQATTDLMMGDLLKNMRSSQIFSVCGLPDVKINKKKEGKATLYQVELLGYDVFDPVTMQPDHKSGDDVPAWFLDTDYNDLCFHVAQAFFPRTAAWDNLKRAMKGEFSESVWEHLSGSKSTWFEAEERRQVGVKVIDDRGNELLVVKKLD